MASSLVGCQPFASRAILPSGTREKAAIPAKGRPLTGDQLLLAVTDAMVALHERYYHRAPRSAKTLLLGDELLACVLGGVYTSVEQTMIELQFSSVVTATRGVFQGAMAHKSVAAVERLSGRDVLTFSSNHHVGPDIQVELFMLRSVQTGPSWTERRRQEAS